MLKKRNELKIHCKNLPIIKWTVEGRHGRRLKMTGSVAEVCTHLVKLRTHDMCCVRIYISCVRISGDGILDRVEIGRKMMGTQLVALRTQPICCVCNSVRCVRRLSAAYAKV